MSFFCIMREILQERGVFMFPEIKDAVSVHEYFGISKNRYKVLFSLESTYSVFRKERKGFEISKNYECIRIYNHDCDCPADVLVDILFQLRSGDFIDLALDDLIIICIGGSLFPYTFCGMSRSGQDDVNRVFVPFDASFFLSEKTELIGYLHEHNMLLDMLSETIFSVSSLPKKCDFFGIQKETYRKGSPSIISEYSIYKLHKRRIIEINPNGNPFYDLKNTFLYFLNKYRSDCVLLYNRRELEMIKDYMDICSCMRIVYGA